MRYRITVNGASEFTMEAPNYQHASNMVKTTFKRGAKVTICTIPDAPVEDEGEDEDPEYLKDIATLCDEIHGQMDAEDFGKEVRLYLPPYLHDSFLKGFKNA